VTGSSGADSIDRRLLTLIQKEFPLDRRPFAVIGERIGISEEDALARARRLKEAGVIRQISAIFDSRRLGYSSTLVAMEIPAEQIDKSAERISEHAGVSHNYKRDHPMNLWFTLTLPPGADLEAEVARLSRVAGARRTRILPALRVFKIGVELDLEQGANAAETTPPTDQPERRFTEEDLDYVRVLQQDLPLEITPFQGWAESLSVDERRLFARARELESSGVMRRFAAVLRHQKAGFLANAMVCWRIPEEQLPDLGYRLASYPEVSHCFQRPVYPDWPYGIYSMVHARSRKRCEEIARRMSQEIGVGDYVILYSTKEYKKERVKYHVR
jgi:DNA-binding Lrp family transcriptional regulator